MFVIEIKHEGEWITGSIHTLEADALKQKERVISRGTREEDVRMVIVSEMEH